MKIAKVALELSLHSQFATSIFSASRKSYKGLCDPLQAKKNDAKDAEVGQEWEVDEQHRAAFLHPSSCVSS
jgi:hypothetical protein